MWGRERDNPILSPEPVATITNEWTNPKPDSGVIQCPENLVEVALQRT